MKKPVTVLIIAAVVLMIFAVILPTVYDSYAGEESAQNRETGGNTGTQTDPETVTKVEDPVGPVSDGKENNEKKSFYTALVDAISDAAEPASLSRTVTWICSLVSVIIITLIRGSLIKIKNRISGTLESATSKTNELVECYNDSNLRIGRLEKDVSLITGAVAEKSARDENTYQAVLSFAEMLFMVYNNSTTIPEGMKDVLRTKYAKMCEAVGDSEDLAAKTEDK